MGKYRQAFFDCLKNAGLTEKSSEVAVIHELPLRKLGILSVFCVSPKMQASLLVEVMQVGVIAL
jgi:hypothetical protein